MGDSEVKDLLKSARDAIAAKKWKEAHEYAKDALVIDKKNYNALVFYGLASAQLHQTGQSEKAYRKAIELSPANLLARQGLIELFWMVSDWPKMLEEMNEVLKTVKPDYPKFQDYHQKKSHALQQMGKKREAIDTLKYLLQNISKDDQQTQNSIWRQILSLVEDMEKETAKQEMEKRIALRQKKLAFVTAQAVEQIRTEVDAEIKREMLTKNQELDEVLEQISKVSAHADADVRICQRILARAEAAASVSASASSSSAIPQAQPSAAILEAKVQARETVRRRIADRPDLQRKQPSYFVLETLLETSEERWLADALSQKNSDLSPASLFVGGRAPPLVMLQRLMHSHPDRPISQVGFALMCFALNRAEESLLLLEVALKKHPDSLLGQYLCCYLLNEGSQDNTLLEHTQKQLEPILQRREKENHASLRSLRDAIALLRASSAKRVNLKKVAAQCYEEVLKSQPNSLPALKGIGQLAFDDANYDSARKYFAQILTLNPQDDAIIAQAGWIEHLAGKDADAQRMLLSAISIRDDVALHHHWLGVVYWSQEGPTRSDKKFAQTEFLLSAKLAPQMASNFTYLGHFYALIESDLARAKKCYQKALSIDPLDQAAGVALADMYLADGQETLAAELYREVTSRSTRIFWAWLRQAVYQNSKNLIADAIESFQTCLRIEPKNVVCWRGLAECYRKEGKFMASLKAFSRLLELDPSSAYGQYQVAAIKLQLGLREEAARSFEEILKSDSNYVPALKGLGEALLSHARESYERNYVGSALHSCRRATTVLQKCAAAQSNLASVWQLLGDACVFLGQLLPLEQKRKENVKSTKEEPTPQQRFDLFSKALKAYLKAIRLSPSSSGLYYDAAIASHYQSVLVCEKDPNNAKDLKEKAVRYIKIAISMSPGSLQFWNALGVVESSLSIRQHAFLTAVTIDRKSGISWSNLGAFYLEANEAHLAQSAFSVAQLMEPHQANGWVGQGLLDELTGNHQNSEKKSSLAKALSVFRQSVALKPTSEGLLGLAFCAYYESDYAIAAESLHSFLQQHPSDVTAWNLYGTTLLQQKRYHDSEEAFSNALQLLSSGSSKSSPSSPSQTPSSSSSSSSAAVTLISPGTTAKLSAAEMERIVRKNRLRALAGLRRYEDAISEFRLCGDDSAQSEQLGGTLLLLDGQYAEAIKKLDKAASLSQAAGDNSRRRAVLLLIARAHFAKGDTNSAKQTIAIAVKENANDAESWRTMTALAILLKDFTAAQAALQHLYRLSPTADHAYLFVLLHRAQGDLKAERAALLRAIHSHPQHHSLWIALARLVHDRFGGSHRSVRSAAANIRPTPKQPDELSLIASLMLEVGQGPESSEKLLRRASSYLQQAIHIGTQSPADLSISGYLLAITAHSIASASRSLEDWNACYRAVRAALPTCSAEELKSSLELAQIECELYRSFAAESSSTAKNSLQKFRESISKKVQSSTSGKFKAISAELIVESHLVLARALQTKFHKLDDAIAEYKSALSQFGQDNTNIIMELGCLYQRRGQFSAAEACFAKSWNLAEAAKAKSAIDPRPVPLLRLAHLHFVMKKYDQSMKELQQLMALDDTLPAVQLLAGLCSQKLNRVEDAEWYLSTAIALQSTVPTANFHLSILHLRRQDVGGAESDCLYERDNTPRSDVLLYQMYLIASSISAAPTPGAGPNAPPAAPAVPIETLRGYLQRAIRINPSRSEYWAELAKLKPKPVVSVAKPPAAGSVAKPMPASTAVPKAAATATAAAKGKGGK